MVISGSADVRITIFARLTDNCIVLELRNIDEVVNILLLKELAACWVLEKFWKVALKGICWGLLAEWKVCLGFSSRFTEYGIRWLKQISEIAYPFTFLCSSHISCLFGCRILWANSYSFLCVCTVLCTLSCQSWQWLPGTALIDMPVNQFTALSHSLPPPT